MAFAWALVLVFVQVPTVAQAKVTASEKQKIEKFLEKNCESYLEECWHRGGVIQDGFKLDNRIKTDMVVYLTKEFEGVNDSTYSALQKKYNLGEVFLYKYNKVAKNRIVKKGKQIFGSSFKVSFASEPEINLVYGIVKLGNKKYIVDGGCTDTSWNDKWEYSSISKKNGVYTIKAELTSDDYKEAERFIIRLKKSGSSYIIKSIKSTK